MTDTHFIVREKNGVNELSFIAAGLKPQRLTVRDGLFIVLFLSAFVGLVFLLAR
jgi:hypothetical protein